MKGLFIRIDDKLEESFTEICKREGYKKTGLLTKLIREFVERHSSDPIREAEKFGIDTTLLDSNLDKTPTERIRENEMAVAFTEKLQQAVQKRT